MKRQNLLMISFALSSALAISSASLATDKPNTTNTTNTPKVVANTTTAAPAPAAATPSFDANQVQQIQQIVHDYLVKNPQVLVEASEVLQKQAMVKVEETAKTAIVANANKVFADPTSPVGGNAKGTVSIVQFFDYQCPHCKEMETIIEKIAADNKNLRIVYKELPIFGTNSKFATNAALASQQQGADKYVKFHNALMAASNPLTNDKVLELAKTSGLNVDQLKKAAEDPKYKQIVDDNYKLAQTLGLIGTPSFIIATWSNGAVKNISFIPGVTTQENIQKAVQLASQ